MRKIAIAVASVMLIAASAFTPALANKRHEVPQRAEPEHVAPVPPPTLPAVTSASLEQLVADADRPVLVLAVFSNCTTCADDETAMAREAKNFTSVAVFKADAAALGLDPNHGSYLLIYVPTQGKTMEIADFHPAKIDLHSFLAGRCSYASNEAAAGRAIQRLEADLYRKSAPFNSKIDALAREASTKLDDLAAQEAKAKAAKADAIKGPTAQLIHLQTERQTATSLPAQAPIEKQAADLQKQIDEQTAKYDGQLTQIATERGQVVEEFTTQHDAIAHDRDEATKSLQERLTKARESLEALITADKQAAQQAAQ